MSGKKSSGPVAIEYQSGADLHGILVKLIDESGMSRYAIAKAADVPESKLSRSYNGKTATTLETVRAVAEALGKRVVVRIE